MVREPSGIIRRHLGQLVVYFFLWDTHHYEVKLTPDTSRSKVHFWPIKSGPNWGSTTKSIRAVDVCRCLQQKLHNTWDPEFSEIIPDHP